MQNTNTVYSSLSQYELSETFKKRFWKKVNKTETCWLWTASTCGGGYGQIAPDKRTNNTKYAHIASWIIHNGPIPNKLQVLHKCDVRNCINPTHLFLGTQKDNIMDAASKNRTIHGEKNPNAKLKTNQVKDICLLLNKGFKAKNIAKQFNISRQSINDIQFRRTWVRVSHLVTP